MVIHGLFAAALSKRVSLGPAFPDGRLREYLEQRRVAPSDVTSLRQFDRPHRDVEDVSATLDAERDGASDSVVAH